MSDQLLIGLGIIVLFGMLAQWLAWRLHLPSILLLLILGIVAGPVSGLVDTEQLFGELLFPFVSLSVGLILFEGGLSLRFAEFRNVGKTIRNLISVGALVTWAVMTTAAYLFLNLSFQISLLFGAILIVTGPTVVLPLLRQIRPKGNLYSIAKWEGIMIDPVGAVIAVLVFEEIISGGFEQFTFDSILGLIKTIILGLGIGWVGAQMIILALRRYWVPDFLHNAAAIMMVITTFIISNLLQHESGLLTVTIMGIVLANQNKVSIKHIIEFKENLRVILISTLFIVLAARLNIEDFTHFNSGTLIFLAVLFFVARPLTVFFSTIGQGINWREKIFLSWLAPRGIVAAAVASIFAIDLSTNGFHEAERLIPLTFFVILATVTIYGLTAGPLARLLKLSESNPQGVLIVGAHKWARELGRLLKKTGIQVLLIDSNAENIKKARRSKLPAKVANVLAEDIIDQLDLQGIGRLLAVTSNDEVNALAALHFQDIFGRSGVFQLPYKQKEVDDEKRVSSNLRGRWLFHIDLTYEKFEQLFSSNATIKLLEIKKDEDLETLQSENLQALMLIDEQRNLYIYTDEDLPKAAIEMQLIYIDQSQS